MSKIIYRLQHSRSPPCSRRPHRRARPSGVPMALPQRSDADRGQLVTALVWSRLLGRRAWGRARYGYWGRPYWRPRYAAWGPGYGYWRPRYAYAGYGYPYYYRPWRPFPVVAFGFGFGPRWWW